MNWFKENKFLAILAALTLIGAGVLGYLLTTAKAKADDASANLETTTAELKRLEGLPVYPNQKNLKTLEEQRQQHQQRIDELQEHLAGMALPLESLSPELFQDRLREAVNAYTREANNARLGLTKGFYMGFDTYQGTPPKAEAAAPLGRELKAIDFLLHQLTANHATELRDIVRQPLPEEGGTPPAKVEPARPGPAGPGAKKKPEVALVKKHTVDLVFLSDQNAFSRILNAIVSAKSQFYIVRSVVVKNEKTTGPSREGGGLPPPAPEVPAAPATPDAPAAAAPNGAPALAAPVAPAAPAAAPAGQKFEFIVGQEKIEVTLSIELLDFAQTPAPADAKGAKAKPGTPK